MNDHCIRVMREVPVPCRRVALLHDLVEDYDISVDEICVLFGLLDFEREALELLTKPEDQIYSDYIDDIAQVGNQTARIVKTADIKDNLSRMDEEHKHNVDKYKKALVKLDTATQLMGEVDIIIPLEMSNDTYTRLMQWSNPGDHMDAVLSGVIDKAERYDELCQ